MDGRLLVWWRQPGRRAAVSRHFAGKYSKTAVGVVFREFYSGPLRFNLQGAAHGL